MTASYTARTADQYVADPWFELDAAEAEHAEAVEAFRQVVSGRHDPELYALVRLRVLRAIDRLHRAQGFVL